MTIGALARAAEVGVETVRFYEREGLLAQPRRPGRGFRHYTSEAVSQVRFIRRAKTLGFTLDEIRELLALRSKPGTPCTAVREQARAKLSAIEDKIQELQRLREALASLADACAGDVAVRDCSILSSLEGGSGARTTSLPPAPARAASRGGHQDR